MQIGGPKASVWEALSRSRKVVRLLCVVYPEHIVTWRLVHCVNCRFSAPKSQKLPTLKRPNAKSQGLLGGNLLTRSLGDHDFFFKV